MIAQDGESVIADSVIFVRNPACNNYHGTSSGVTPSSPTPTPTPAQIHLNPIKVSDFGLLQGHAFLVRVFIAGIT